MSFRLLPGAKILPADRHNLNDYPALLAQAQKGLDRRRKAYPQLVAKGDMTEASAAADIAAWALIVAEWTWIISGKGTPPSPHTLFDRIDAVNLALKRVETGLRRRPKDAELCHQQDLILAMRWHLTNLRHGVPACHFWAALTHEMRKAAAPAQRAAA